MATINLEQIWPDWHAEAKPLGKGSYGTVYKAIRQDNNLTSYSAVKVISIPQDPSEIDTLRSEGLDMNQSKTYLKGVVDDFVKEIQLMQSFKGTQNIVSVEDYKVVPKTDEVGWDIYIRMELLTSFNEYVCDKKLTEQEVIKLGIDICTALEMCESRNIIHRDIKPDNIFINNFGFFKLGDFGIARTMANVTNGMSQKGTPFYMAPEVFTTNRYDGRVDICSLGIVLYKLLNNDLLPFIENKEQLMNPNAKSYALERRRSGETMSPPCEASPAMANLILRACAHNPDDRFANASEMKAALMSVQNGTYQVPSLDLDATTSVRRKGQNLDSTTSVRRKEPNPDGTTSVRRAPQSNNEAPNTFGGKKKSKTPAIIAAVLAVILLVGVGIFAVPKLLGGNDNTNPDETAGQTSSETADYSKFDEEQIATIISEAEAIVDDDLEGAITKIQTGLVTYPKSADLQNKLDDYSERMAAQIKAETLDKAAELADSGDYLGAIQTVNQAMESVGDDSSLVAAANTYKDAYVKSVISEADLLVNNGDYDGAINVCQSAYNTVRDNRLQEKIDLINSQKPVTIDISSLKMIDSNLDFYGNADSSVIDTYGNTYDRPILFDGVDDYVTYYTSGKYITLSGFVAAHDGMEYNYSAVVTIYADDVLVYTSPEITRTTKPVEVSIDISGADTITIKSKGNINYGDHEGAIVKLLISSGDKIDLKQESSLNYKDTQDVATLKIVESDLHFYGIATTITKDTYGNIYDSPLVFDGANDFVTYYTANGFTTLEGTIAAHDGMEHNYVSVVTIYADDVLVYTSPEITRTTKPLEVSIDISGADIIKIVSTGNINYGDHEGAIVKLTAKK